VIDSFSRIEVFPKIQRNDVITRMLNPIIVSYAPKFQILILFPFKYLLDWLNLFYGFIVISFERGISSSWTKRFLARFSASSNLTSLSYPYTVIECEIFR